MGNRLPPDFIDQVLSRIDLVEIIDSRVPLRRVGREFAACCPFHSERTPSFTVSPQKQFYHCFGCGAHGNAIGFLMAYDYVSFIEAVEDLARSAGMELPRQDAVPRDDHTHLLRLVSAADHYFRLQLREHPERQTVVDYLRGRGLHGETVARYGIGFAPKGSNALGQYLRKKMGASVDALLDAGLSAKRENGQVYDRFRQRVMFPIRNRRGQTIAFGARSMGHDKGPKYLNSPETPFFHKSQELYGLFEAQRERQLSKLLVVEGYMDVVMLAQHDIPYAVATLGTATTTQHVERLFRLVTDVVFCFDGDQAGKNAAWRAVENSLPALRDGRQARFLFLPEGEDPDSLVQREGKAAFEARIDSALPLSEYFFSHLGGQADLKTPEAKARLAERARPLISKLPDSDFRDFMGERLKSLTGTRRTQSAKTETRGTPTPGTPNLSRSPIRLAIALLLNDPTLARCLDDITFLTQMDIPGLALLVELIELIQSRPHIRNAAALLSHFEGSEKGQVLDKLMQGRLLIDPDDFEKEFLGIFQQLRKRHSPDKRLFEELIQKGGFEALSQQEKEKLLNSFRKDQL